jgi:hypothetical protein
MTENARQHFKMKYQLAAMALQKPQRFLASYGKPGAHYLAMLWNGIGQELPAEARVPSTGLAATTLEVDGVSLSAITFPPPSARGDAYFLAVLTIEQTCRVFLLELAIDPQGNHDTVLVEIKPDGRANWGTGPVPDLASFAGAVASLIRDPSQEPLSFTRMRFA